MLKQFNDTAKALFVARLLERFPAYKYKKSLRAFLAGAAVLEMNIDANRSAWIAFGGFKEAEFAVFAGWTVSGMSPKELPEWGQQANPNAFTPPPAPPDAWVDLRDRWRFEPSQGGKWFGIDISDPALSFQEQVYSAYIVTEAFEKDVENSIRGAQVIYKQNMPSLEKIRETCLRTERTYCRLWSHLAKRHSFSDEEIFDLVNQPVQTAIELVEKYGQPLIQQRLSLPIA